MSRIADVRALARQYNWRIVKPRRPFRHGYMLVHYVLLDDFGEVAFENLDELEAGLRKLAFARGLSLKIGTPSARLLE
jgi:hypothetical protein